MPIESSNVANDMLYRDSITIFLFSFRDFGRNYRDNNTTSRRVDVAVAKSVECIALQIEKFIKGKRRQ